MLNYPISQRSSTAGSQAQGHSRLSSWFHGCSVIGNERPRCYHRSPKTWRRIGLSTSLDEPLRNSSVSGLRSPSSTRSIIDPSSSPNVGTGTAAPIIISHISRHGSAPLESARYDEEWAMRDVGTTRTRLALSMPKRKPKATKARHQCLPGIQSRQVKRKAIGCLVSGGLLAIILTACESAVLDTVRTRLKNNRPRVSDIKICSGRIFSCDIDHAYTINHNCLLSLSDTTLYACHAPERT